jgi:CspA family cold shock protein
MGRSSPERRSRLTSGRSLVRGSRGSKDVFVHISAVERSGTDYLTEGQKISYEVESGRNGKSSAVALKAK